MTPSPSEKRRKTDEQPAIEDDLNEQLQSIWKNSTTPLEDTVSLIGTQMDGLIRTGLDAFHRWEDSSRELQLLKEDYKGQQVEFERLRSAEEKGRQTVSNLLTALETSRTQAANSSRTALSQAALRGELAVTVSQRDEATALAEESKRKAQLLGEDLRSTKNKLARVTQEKAKMERDQRATLSLAKSLDHSATNTAGADYYKRKVSDLQNQVQSLHAVVAEKNRQLDEARRQAERTMSQNRLAQMQRGRKRGSL